MKEIVSENVQMTPPLRLSKLVLNYTIDLRLIATNKLINSGNKNSGMDFKLTCMLRYVNWRRFMLLVLLKRIRQVQIDLAGIVIRL